MLQHILKLIPRRTTIQRLCRSLVENLTSGSFGSVVVDRAKSGILFSRADDTDQHCQSTGRNWPSSYGDLAEFFDFVQTILDDHHGNGADLPVSIPSDALQHRRAVESDRRLKHHLAVQPPFLQADYPMGKKSVCTLYDFFRYNVKIKITRNGCSLSRKCWAIQCPTVIIFVYLN